MGKPGDRGQYVPYFVGNKMVDKEKIGSYVSGILAEDMFLVDITISKSNVVCIYIDSLKNITIDDCVAVSRHVASELGPEADDFEIQVSSPGVGQPFRVKQQFLKNTGRQIELSATDGKVYKGRLESAGENSITLSARVKEKTETGKKQEITRILSFDYDSIKSAATVVTFNNLKEIKQ